MGRIPSQPLRRLIAHPLAILVFTTLFAPVVRADQETWLFNGTTHEWKTSSGSSITAGSQYAHVFFDWGGALYSAPSPNLFHFVPATGSNGNYLRMGYRSTTGAIAKLKFEFLTEQRTSWNTSSSAFIPIVHDGAWHYVTFQTDQYSDWRTSTAITRIRLIAYGAGGGGATGEMDIDFFVLRLDDKDPLAPVVDGVTPSDWTNGTITVTAHGDDPPPNAFSGTTNPDIYASGVVDFGWRVNGGNETWQQYTNGYDIITGTANLTLTFSGSQLSPGCNTLSIRTRDRCGRIGPTTTTTLYAGNGYRIAGRSTSYETGLPVVGDVITYGTECSPGPAGQVTTDASGYYQTPLLSVGNYSVGAGSCPDVSHQCQFGNPISIGCSGDRVVNFRQKGLVAVTGASATVLPDGRSLRINWDPGNAYTSRFRILSSTSPTGPFVTVAEANPPFVHGGLACGTTRYYQVAPINNCGRIGQASSVFSATIPCPTVSGSVEDGTTHLAVPGATVNLLSGSVVVASTLSGPDGLFSMTAPGDGAFTMQTIQADGYWPLHEAATIEPFEAYLHLASLTPVGVPINVQSVSNEADGSVLVSWRGTAEQTSAYELFQKPSVLDDTAYALCATVSGNDTTYVDHPTDGVSHDYKVRAVVTTSGPLAAGSRAAGLLVVRSRLSGSTRAEVVSGLSGMAPPSKVVAKSYGNGRTFILHVFSQKESISFTGIDRILIDVYDRSPCGGSLPNALQRLVADVPKGTTGELGVSVTNFSSGVPYWFGVRFSGKRGESAPTFSQCAGAVAQAPPVVFVHGIWGNPADMAAMATKMHEYNSRLRAGVVSFECSGDRWTTWSSELRDKINAALSPSGNWPYDERVDIVAHSQGGLAAREYIERRGGASRVRALVMMGTPNHGGEFARLGTRLFPRAAYFLCESRGIYQLAPNNFDLKTLNYGRASALVTHDDMCPPSPRESQPVSRKGDVRYYVIAGTAADLSDLSKLNKRSQGALYAVLRGSSCISDGVVPVRSVRIREFVGTSECYQWSDQDLASELNGKRLTHASMTKGWSLKGSIEYTKCAELSHFIATRLLTTTLPTASQLPRSTDLSMSPCRQLGTLEMEMMESGEEPDTIGCEVISSAGGAMEPGSTSVEPVVVDSCGALVALVNTGDWSPGLRLRMPDGTYVVPQDTLTTPWLQFEPPDSSGISTFRVLDPPSGRWEVEISSPLEAEAPAYTVVWGSEASPFRLAVRVEPENPNPGDTVIVSALFANGGLPVAATMTANITDPQGGIATFVLSDAPGGADRNPDDLTYEGRYVVPMRDGGYVVSVIAGTSGAAGTTITRTSGTSFSASLKPDLATASAGLSMQPLLGQVGMESQLRALVRNLGPAGCENARIVFRDSTAAESLGVAVVSLASGDSTAVQIAWVPKSRGEHRIAVDLELDGALDGDIENNLAVFTVTVAGPVPTADVESSRALPTVLSMSPPWPNPFRHGVLMRVSVPSHMQLEVSVFDVAGRRIRSLIDGPLEPGEHIVAWDGTDQRGLRQSAGVYFIRLGGPNVTAKRTVVRLN